MDFKKLAQQAKDAVDKRGGTDALKEDFAELKGIAKGQGSLTDKAKEAAAVLKEPGDSANAPPASPSPEPDASAAPKPDPAAPGPEHHGKHGGRGKGGHRQAQP
jgi:hypothetical protein